MNTAERTFYVDSFGNILEEKGATDKTVFLAFVLSIKRTATLDGSNVIYAYEATIVDVGGNVSAVPTSEEMYTDRSDFINNLCAYNKAGGLYIFDDDIASFDTADALISTITKITKGTPTLTGAVMENGGKKVENAGTSTKFVYINYGPTGAPDRTVKVYNGINQVPTYDLTKVTSTGYAVCTSTMTTGTPSVLVTTPIASVVFITGDPSTSTTRSIVYYLGTYTAVQGGYNLDVVINGEKDAIFVTTFDAATFPITAKAGLYFDFDVTAGKVTVKPPPPPANVDPYDDCDFEIDGGFLFIDGEIPSTAVYIADDVPVYVFHPASWDSITAEDFDGATLEDTNIAYIVWDSDAKDEVVAVYVILT